MNNKIKNEIADYLLNPDKCSSHNTKHDKSTVIWHELGHKVVFNHYDMDAEIIISSSIVSEVRNDENLGIGDTVYFGKCKAACAGKLNHYQNSVVSWAGILAEHFSYILSNDKAGMIKAISSYFKNACDISISDKKGICFAKGYNDCEEILWKSFNECFDILSDYTVSMQAGANDLISNCK